MQTLVARVAVSAAVYSIDRPYDYAVPPALQHAAREGSRVSVPFGKSNKETNGIILSLYSAEGEDKRRKSLTHVFSDEFSLDEGQKALALWICQRYFCTFFQAADALLPPGIWTRLPETFSLAAPYDEGAVELTAKKRRILSVLDGAEKPMTAAEIAKESGLESITSELRALARAGVLDCKQHFAPTPRENTVRLVRPALPQEEALARLGGRLTPQRRAALDCIYSCGVLPEKELCYRTGVNAGVVHALADKGILLREDQPVSRLSQAEPPQDRPIELTAEQDAVWQGLRALMDTGRPEAALLYGVTGSGKTQIYLRLIREALDRGKTAIMLVPEIALTPQTVRLFRGQFGGLVAVVHSGMTDAQRRDAYYRISHGDARVIVGTRTAVLSPCKNIGCIILDEEHEPSYRSENDPRYHARDVAKYRAAQENCLLLLGSATPSVESYYAAEQGAYKLFRLEHRFQNVPLPQTLLADMRGRLMQGDPSRISPELEQELGENLRRGEQSILFLNRRGAARMAACVECGHVPQCVNCSVPLVYHSRNNRLMCHHCGYSIPMPAVCPACGGDHLKLIGSGTQRIEDDLQDLFPTARLIRMDADTTEGRTTHEALLEDFASGKADILLGTQMVAKGLDFPRVTLVGVLDADLSLYSGDYHAAERTFSLLTQVVGRAGRRDKRGRAVIQTYTPDNPVIRAAAAQDYDGFYRGEIASRRALQAPPFTDLFVFRFGGGDEASVHQASLQFARLLRDKLPSCPDAQNQILGPAPAAIAKVNKRYYDLVTFRGKSTPAARRFASGLLSKAETLIRGALATVSLEINPLF